MFRVIRAFSSAVRGSNVLAPEVIGEPEKTFPTFPFKVQAAIGYIPRPIQEFLRQANTQIILAPTILTAFDLRPDLDLVDGLERLEHIAAEALYLRSNALILPQQHYNPIERTSKPIEDYTHITLHELGHAVSNVVEINTGTSLDQSPAFIAAFERDLKQLKTNPDRLNAAQKWHGYIRLESNSPENISLNQREVFAELFYEQMSGRRKLALFFPHSFAQIPTLLEAAIARKAKPSITHDHDLDSRHEN